MGVGTTVDDNSTSILSRTSTEITGEKYSNFTIKAPFNHYTITLITIDIFIITNDYNLSILFVKIIYFSFVQGVMFDIIIQRITKNRLKIFLRRVIL